MKRKTRRVAVTVLGTAAVLVLVYTTLVAPHRERNAALHAIATNLRILEGARECWALERGVTNGALPALADLAPYLKNGHLTSAAGEVYAITPVGALNTATLTRKLAGKWKTGQVLTVTNF
jgi:hypothetical protein